MMGKRSNARKHEQADRIVYAGAGGALMRNTSIVTKEEATAAITGLLTRRSPNRKARSA